ncbi:MarR family winged helix-turn-helix transcriptional regulator [Paracoccus saliphilus]|uniref:DNA-binding transcriptional regulator, MarR family n=2 Tax=Paracoccus saliphilus TaxID=405559 RepID=A0AA45W7J2_9RHOB|nr:MarR family winged helix-turn-helix transcriptional regulator [Paracoccus saliphilus]SIT10151.1 DNA-binding transcriptional regulator, MarR family [Paracoccus saliphilus]
MGTGTPLDRQQMLEGTLSSDLRYLMAVSYIVLANNQVTNRYIERRYDMPVHAWSTLYAIVTYPGLRAKDIQHLFPRPQNTISRVVALLERRGLVRQVVSDQDGRAKSLLPTPAGTRLLDEIKAKALERQNEMFSVLDDEERQTFLELCRKIAAGDRLCASEAMKES